MTNVGALGGEALHHCTSCNYRLLRARHRAEGFTGKPQDGSGVTELEDISTQVWKPAVSVCASLPVVMTVAMETCLIGKEGAKKHLQGLINTGAADLSDI